MRSIARVARLSALVAAVVVFFPARASAEDSEYGFGVVPGVRFGPNFGTVPNGAFVPAGTAPPESQVGRGWLFEPHLDGLFAGRTLGAGVSLGYVFQGMGNPYDEEKSGLGYEGLTLTPMVMLALDPRVFLVAKGGLVFGDIANGSAEDVSATGWRVGGQLMFVAYRNAGADLTLGLDFIHTQATGEYPAPGGTIDYSANAICIDSTFTFFADLLDL